MGCPARPSPGMAAGTKWASGPGAWLYQGPLLQGRPTTNPDTFPPTPSLLASPSYNTEPKLLPGLPLWARQNADGRLPRSFSTGSCARESKAVMCLRKRPPGQGWLRVPASPPAPPTPPPLSTTGGGQARPGHVGPPQTFLNLSQQITIPGPVRTPAWTQAQGLRGSLVSEVSGRGRRWAGSPPQVSGKGAGKVTHTTPSPRLHLSLVSLREQLGRDPWPPAPKILQCTRDREG